MIPDEERGNDEPDTDRLAAFSDGVFAFAITLLGLNLAVPDHAKIHSASALAAALRGQWPIYLAFVVSFATILIMWMNHHAMFKLVRTGDPLLMFANGLLLLLLIAVPFSTELVAEYLGRPGATTATAVYAGLFVGLNVAYNLLWWSAAHNRRLLKPSVAPAEVRKLSRYYLIGFVPYLVATIVAFWSPYASIGICAGLWIFWALTAHAQSRQAQGGHAPRGKLTEPSR